MPRILIATLCDDVREEVAGKASVMGIFNQFRVADFRSPMPSFWIFARVEFEGPGDYAIRTELRTVEGQEIFQLTGVAQLRQIPDQNHPRRIGRPTADLKFKIDNLTLPRDGVYELAFFHDDRLLQTFRSRRSFSVRLLSSKAPSSVINGRRAWRHTRFF